MRGFIKFCAGLFVIAGALVVLAAVIMAVAVVAFDQSVPGEAGMASVVVIVIGLASGASIVLVGGGTYLLASIDYRLELAARESRGPGAKPSVPDQLAAA